MKDIAEFVDVDNIPDYLVNERFNDRYFDVVNAIDEAQQIHFRNNELIRRIKIANESERQFIIGETGFGAGRIVVSLMEFLRLNGVRGASVEYNSVEIYPISSERMHKILSGFRDRVGAEIDTLEKAYGGTDITVPGWHSMKLIGSFGTIELRLWIGEALEMVSALPKQCDVWFLDGHGPKKNPSMWRPELLKAIGAKTKEGGSCSTFTVSGAVRRALSEAGFTIERLPGCGGKKQVLHGIKSYFISA